MDTSLDARIAALYAAQDKPAKKAAPAKKAPAKDGS